MAHAKEDICLTEENFDKIEKDILNEVTNVSKSLIASFKFRMLYGTKVTKKQNKQTLKHLKEFRTKHWDKKLSRKDAYKKYVNMY